MFEEPKKTEAPAELAQLESEAKRVDQAAPAAGEASAAPKPAEAAQLALDEAETKEWSQCPAIMGRILGRWMPELKDDYSEKNCMEWGRAMLPIARKYNWTLQKLVALLGPWVGLAIATEPFVVGTAVAVRTRIQAAREAEAKRLQQEKDGNAPAGQ